MHTYIFDFDYTLFDTNAMRVALQQELNKQCGTTQQEYQTAEKQITEHGALYSLEAHIDALFFDADSREKGRAVAESIVQRMGEWVYDDVVPVLESFQKQNARLILLSFGNHDWQQLKITHSGIAVFFETVEIVTGSKTEPVHLFEQQEAEEIVCINDRATEINELHGVFPDITYYWISRPETPYNQIVPTVPHRKISSFSEIVATLPV